MYRVTIKREVSLSVKEFVKKIMPDVLFEAVASGFPGRMTIQYAEDKVYVGYVAIKPAVIEFNADETDPMTGFLFWQAFVRKNPQLSPFRIGYGILYHPAGLANDVFQLDKEPVFLMTDALKEVESYKNTAEAYFVDFDMGYYHPFESLVTNHCCNILPSGQVGHDLGAQFFHLGKMENAATM